MSGRTVVSLFSGIGGMDEGLRRAGWKHVAFCESDSYRRDVLRARFPGVPVCEDVRALGEPAARIEADRRGTELVAGGREAGTGLPGGGDVALLCGGFPCQDVSVAGRRAGLAGERSGLFHEFARIADALRPQWLLVENVSGLLSSNGGRDFGVVLGTLAELGYGVAWRILDSRFFGVPQRRRRVFIVGTLAGDDPRAAAGRAGEVLAVGSRCPGHPATRGEAREGAASTSANGAGDGRPHYYVEDFEDGTLTSSTGRIDRHPLLAESGAQRVGRERDASLVAAGAGAPDIAAPLSHGSNPNSNAAGRRREDDENLVVAGPLGGGNDGIGRRSEDDPNLVAYPLARRGRSGGSELEVGEADIYNALRAGDGGSSRLNQILTPEASVRRLMPVECERLQALPDGWTDIGGTPDSRRYAALGDAVTVSVAEWIGRRLIEAAA